MYIYNYIDVSVITSGSKAHIHPYSEQGTATLDCLGQDLCGLHSQPHSFGGMNDGRYLLLGPLKKCELSSHSFANRPTPKSKKNTNN